VKRCPTCNQTFSDRHLSFCVDDGTPLVDFDPQADEATVVPTAGKDESGKTGEDGPSAGSSERNVPPYQPPGSYIPPDASTQKTRRTWPWVLGILALVLVVLAGLGIAAVILIPRMVRESANQHPSNSNVSRTDNSNRNSNSANSNTSPATGENENGNNNSAEDTSPPPTDQQEVLADLKDLEDEWTAANINADKKQLNRILADDYVDTSEGKPRGKAEYLKTAERDISIQHWEFEGLKVSLKGDRATLSGIIRLEVKDQQGQIRPVALTFTDKFVWRDGRWQATGSEVSPLKE
jgi:ketosteroid isomerase-like protein